MHIFLLAFLLGSASAGLFTSGSADLPIYNDNYFNPFFVFQAHANVTLHSFQQYMTPDVIGQNFFAAAVVASVKNSSILYSNLGFQLLASGSAFYSSPAINFPLLAGETYAVGIVAYTRTQYYLSNKTNSDGILSGKNEHLNFTQNRNSFELSLLSCCLSSSVHIRLNYFSEYIVFTSGNGTNSTNFPSFSSPIGFFNFSTPLQLGEVQQRFQPIGLDDGATFSGIFTIFHNDTLIYKSSLLNFTNNGLDWYSSSWIGVEMPTGEFYFGFLLDIETTFYHQSQDFTNNWINSYASNWILTGDFENPSMNNTEEEINPYIRFSYSPHFISLTSGSETTSESTSQLTSGESTTSLMTTGNSELTSGNAGLTSGNAPITSSVITTESQITESVTSAEESSSISSTLIICFAFQLFFALL